MASSSRHNPISEADWTLKYLQAKSDLQTAYIEERERLTKNLLAKLIYQARKLPTRDARLIADLFEPAINDMLGLQVPARYPESYPNAPTLPQLLDRQRTYIKRHQDKMMGLLDNMSRMVTVEWFRKRFVYPVEAIVNNSNDKQRTLQFELRKIDAQQEQETRRAREREAQENARSTRQGHRYRKR